MKSFLKGQLHKPGYDGAGVNGRKKLRGFWKTMEFFLLLFLDKTVRILFL